MKTRYVLDTEAFVLYLMAQEGGAIQGLLHDAQAGRHKVLMNVYNLAEVYVRLAKTLSGEQLDQVLRAAQALPIQRISVSDPLVFSAARLRVNAGLTQQQAMAMATALQEDASLVTPDPPPCTPEGLSVCPLVNMRQAESVREMLVGVT